MATAYAIGHISGGHYNPAVTLGLVAAGKFSKSDAPSYIISQCLAGIASAFMFYTVASGKAGFTAGNFASNMYGGDGYSMMAVFLIEALLTAFLMLVILGVTRNNGPSSMAPLAIGDGSLERSRHAAHVREPQSDRRQPGFGDAPGLIAPRPLGEPQQVRDLIESESHTLGRFDESHTVDRVFAVCADAARRA